MAVLTGLVTIVGLASLISILAQFNYRDYSKYRVDLVPLHDEGKDEEVSSSNNNNSNNNNHFRERKSINEYDSNDEGEPDNNIRERQPNIVFILADDLGYNDVPWTNPDIHAPNLDILSRESVILENHYAMSVCVPSRAALMTGYYPTTTGTYFMVKLNLHFNQIPTVALYYYFINLLKKGARTALRPEGLRTRFTMLPRYLKNLGYSTHAIGKWHLGFCNDSYLPNNRGFDTFFGYYTGSMTYYSHLSRFSDRSTGRVFSYYDIHDSQDSQFYDNHTYSSDLFTQRALRVIRNHGDDPFFLYLSYQNVHAPLQIPPITFNKKSHDQYTVRDIMKEMIYALDTSVGQVMETIRNSDLEEDTIIIFSSDNGGVPCLGGSNSPYKGGKHTVWEGGSKVPAFIKLPKRYQTKPGSYNGLFHFVDWLPTLYEAGGGDNDDLHPGIDGISQWKALMYSSVRKIENGAGYPRDEILYIHLHPFKNNTRKGAIRKSNFKLIFGQAMDGAVSQADSPLASDKKSRQKCWGEYHMSSINTHNSTRVRLYNLKDDPGESQDVSQSNPNLVTRLTELFDQAISKAVLEPDYDSGENKGKMLKNQIHMTGWCFANY